MKNKMIVHAVLCAVSFLLISENLMGSQGNDAIVATVLQPVVTKGSLDIKPMESVYKVVNTPPLCSFIINIVSYYSISRDPNTGVMKIVADSGNLEISFDKDNTKKLISQKLFFVHKSDSEKNWFIYLEGELSELKHSGQSEIIKFSHGIKINLNEKQFEEIFDAKVTSYRKPFIILFLALVAGSFIYWLRK